MTISAQVGDAPGTPHERDRFGIEAHAAIRAEARSGATRLTTLCSDPPLTLRTTPGEVHLVGTAAGPIGGDLLTLDLDVGADAHLVLRSAAASIVLPGPFGQASNYRVSAAVGSGASLAHLPRPAVLVAGCDHRVTTTIDLDAGARLVWREEFVFGRHDEPGGSLFQRMRVDLDGSPLLRTDLAVGSRWPWSTGPAGTDGRRVIGTVVVVGTSRPDLALDDVPGVRAAVLRLDGPAVMVTAAGDSAAAVGRVLDQAGLAT